jgi:hypothetical protein
LVQRVVAHGTDEGLVLALVAPSLAPLLEMMTVESRAAATAWATADPAISLQNAPRVAAFGVIPRIERRRESIGAQVM